ncbi:MAG: metallophosphoesterase [Phycisphaerae bacterium]|nr:metallophosphoesterase [Phycisphaerae bacterium]
MNTRILDKSVSTRPDTGGGRIPARTWRYVTFLPLLVGALWLGCAPQEGQAPTVLPDINSLIPGKDTLLVRLVQVTDTHITDALSPGRLSSFDGLASDAWRPQEPYATQILDGLVRSINQFHEEVGRIDLVLHTGDAVDNAQGNEFDWFLGVMDGNVVDPLSGPDDRESWQRPPALLDPYHAFQAEGLYVQGRHGQAATIPWLATIGNHDVFAVGNFPIVQEADGRRTAPLPLYVRPGIWLPSVLRPDGYLAHSFVSPANPGPPRLLDVPVWVEPNPDRAFVARHDIVAKLSASSSEPLGHGFYAAGAEPPVTWYRRVLNGRIRLIVLDTADVPAPLPGLPYFGGSISQPQLDWLRGELSQASDEGQWVVVASHHPSGGLYTGFGSAVGPEEFRQLLAEHGNVILHVAGHTHHNRVMDWGTHIEMVTGSLIEYPQTARVVEIHEDVASGEVSVHYAPISPLESQDELSALRQEAYDLALSDVGRAASKCAQKLAVTAPDKAQAASWLAGSTKDQEGQRVIATRHR